MKETEFKPCPFCGSGNIAFYSYDPYDGYMGNLSSYYAECHNCGAKIKDLDPNTCADKWNRRVDNERREAD